MMKRIFLTTLWLVYALHGISQSLVSYYPLNGSAADAMGAVNGTVSGATLTTDRFGNTTSAYSFNGSGNYISLGNNSANRPTAALSVSVWVNLNPGGTSTHHSVVGCTESGGWKIDYIVATESFVASVFRNGSLGSVSVPVTASFWNTWHFLAMTYDGRYLRFYIDGILQGVNDAGGNYAITYGNNLMLVGAEPSGVSGIQNGEYYQGILDDIKIYNYELSSNDLLSEMQAALPIPGVGLQLWLSADSGVVESGGIVTQWNDLSGNNNHAIQPNTSKRPTLLLQELHHKPVIQFDGLDDILQTSSKLNLNNTKTATIFIVNKSFGEAICLEQSDNTNSNSGGFYISDNYQNTGFAVAVKGNVSGPQADYLTMLKSNSLNTTYHISTVSIDKSQASYQNQIKARIDGVDLLNTGYGGTPTDNLAADTLYIGGRKSGGNFMHGGIAAVIIYNRLLSSTERVMVENYLNLRYATSSNLAITKPGSGGAIHFDGSNDKLTLPITSFTAYTIEAWVKFNSTAISNKNILVYTAGTATSTWSHQIRTSSTGKFQHYTYDGSANNVIGTTTINPNVWYHVAITAQNNGTARLFVNGVEEGTAQSVGALYNSGTQIQAAVPTGYGASSLNGELDEIRIWNYARTTEQIRTTMCRKITTCDSDYDRLSVYLNSDESSASTCYDLSWYARNATLSNGAFHVSSGAPIGNQSAFDYNGASSSVNLTNNFRNDYLQATISAGTPKGIQVYCVHDYPEVLTGADTISGNNAYFGVFVPSTTTYTLASTYHYTGISNIQQESSLSLYSRMNNAALSWINTSAVLDTNLNTLTTSSTQAEFLVGHLEVPQNYYYDQDGDGYGNPAIFLFTLSPPPNYVVDNTDCNDSDALEHPGQVWYLDVDMDGYASSAAPITQCSRPLNRKTTVELQSTSGDCDDNDALIFPGSVSLNYSATTLFSTSVIHPQSGDSYTDYMFEVIYTDVKGQLPRASFPRVYLDFEGNGIYNNSNDRTIIMMEDDVNDSNTADGKKYIAQVSALPANMNWKTLIQVYPDLTNCNGAEYMGPFDYPDVYIQPDLELFANDITFSENNPAPSSPLQISATVHNVSDFDASNVVVHLKNQNMPTEVYTNITIGMLAAHSQATVVWTITTPATPSWNPMEVTVDYTEIISESNENDNKAVRPFINGNYNLPGSIVSYVHTSPSVSYVQGGAYNNFSGHCYYTGTAVPLQDSSVAGATVTFTILETGATYSTYTNSNGLFSYSFPRPLIEGLYHIQGTVTDYSLTGPLNSIFEVLPPVIPVCTLPDLTVQLYLSSQEIVVGHSIGGSILVKNVGQTASISTQVSFNNSGGITTNPGSFIVPALMPGSSFSISLDSIFFDQIGSFSICTAVDPTDSISECNESNNQVCQNVLVYPALPDIVPTRSPMGSAYGCETNAVNFEVSNHGGISTGVFNCLIKTYFGSTLIATHTHQINNILPAQFFPSNKVSFSIPFTPQFNGLYTFQIICDTPNTVQELNEVNNQATYTLTVIPCAPDLAFYGCNQFDVVSLDGKYNAGDNVEIKNVIHNQGNMVFSGIINMNYNLSSGPVYTNQIMATLAPGSSMPLNYTIPAPVAGNTTLTVNFTAPGDNNPANNSISNKMCWDFQPTSVCGTNFWDKNYLVNEAVYLYCGVTNPYLYNSDTLHVRFEVSGPGISGVLNLGDATLYNVNQVCGCPYVASLPISYAFSSTGTYTVTMTVDPEHRYAECDELNNVLVRHVVVNNLPDYRVLSQFINPSELNPDPNEAITLNVTYENIGTNNAGSSMKMRVKVDNTVLEDIFPVGGLMKNDNATITISTPWLSNLVGVHVIRAIIDQDNDIAETNELNNEATRAIVVGEASNLYFQEFFTLTPEPELNDGISIKARLGNSGDLYCGGVLSLSYINDLMDTVYIGQIPFTLNPHDSTNVSYSWNVVDKHCKIIGQIINSSTLEYTYDDNSASFEIGELHLILVPTPACASGNTGTISSYMIGGEEPASYLWSNGFSGSQLNAVQGSYSVTVTDATGQSVQASSAIPECMAILNLKLYLQGYYESNGIMKPVLKNQGQLSLSSFTDTLTIELHDTTASFNTVYSFTGIINTDGSIAAYFPMSASGLSFYIVIKHRNHLLTWSTSPVLINTITSYDFSVQNAMSFGNSSTEVEPGIWAIFVGDVNQDESIDAFDFLLLEPNIINGMSGYHATDINGDGAIDIFDYLGIETQIINGITAQKP